MSESTVVVHPDRSALVGACGARLLTAILDAVADRGHAHLVLTGGSMGSAVLAALVEQPAARAVDWSAVTLWWGDERFLPAGDAERNATQSLAALQGVRLVPEQVHEVAAAGAGSTLGGAAADYAELVAARVEQAGDAPAFDVVMLGVGPDGHVASLFPQHAMQSAGGWAVGVTDSPKPPPERVSMTFDALRQGRAVWFLVAGGDKADAVSAGVRGAPATASSAAQVKGRAETLWLVDEAAAEQLD